MGGPDPLYHPLKLRLCGQGTGQALLIGLLLITVRSTPSTVIRRSRPLAKVKAPVDYCTSALSAVDMSIKKFFARSSAVTKRPCNCRVSQLWPQYNWKMIFCTEPYRSIFNHCDVINRPPISMEFDEITQNNLRAKLRRWRSFKVTNFGTTWKPICNLSIGNRRF